MRILCMCVACFIGTASFFDGPFSKLILIFSKICSGFMPLAGFQRLESGGEVLSIYKVSDLVCF